MANRDDPRAQQDDRTNMPAGDMGDEERVRGGGPDDVRGIADDDEDEFEDTGELEDDEEGEGAS